MLMDLIKGLASPLTELVGKFIEDKDKRNELAVEVERIVDAAAARVDEYVRALLESRTKLVLAEATGHSWLQRNWRPLMMLWFGVLLGLYWFGITPPNMTEAVVTELFGLLKIGIGGYVVGRSVEKVAPMIADAWVKRG